MAAQVAERKLAGQYDAAALAITRVGLKTLAVKNDSGVAEPEADYHIDASDVDIDRLFEEAGRALSHGLHMTYWQANADRDALDVKVEVIVLACHHSAMSAMESAAEMAFDTLYDTHKKSIAKLKEQRRSSYERLRLATAKPTEVPWHLPESIDFNRVPADPQWDRHIYVESDGQFRAGLGTWEAGVLQEELAKPDVVGWLRNLDRKPWSLEIPYETGGAIRPMFPDLVIARKVGDDVAVDILEPHRPDLDDNFEKAKGLARFAEHHGALFGRVQLIRKQASPAGGEHYARLEINKAATIKQLLLITSNPQLDDLFAKHAE
jgi:type III restriction enzyme